VDLYFLQDAAGSLLDAASHVVRAALANTFLPSISTVATTVQKDSITAISGVTSSTSDSSNKQDAAATVDLVVDGDMAQARPPAGVDQAPCIVTVTVLKCPVTGKLQAAESVLIVDADVVEEACAFCSVHVAVDTTSQTVCALRKTGRGALPVALLPEITATALQVAAKASQYYQRKSPDATSQPASGRLLQEQFAMQ
jgi:exosome complex RNA-binding protein Rrp42 (RNase PH superfamily)